MASNQNVNKVVYAGTTLIDLTGDDVTAASVLSGKKFHLPSGAAATGTIASQAAQTITPGTSDQTIAAGKYLTGAQTIKGDANLVAENIAEGVSIFGVTGTYAGGINGDYALFNQLSSVAQSAFKDNSAITEAYFSACTSIGNSAFANCTNLEKIHAQRCTSIGKGAFYWCTKLSDISFPTCTNIYSHAFTSCTSLSIADFPACTYIETSSNSSTTVFTNCTGLRVLSFPALTNVSAYMWNGYNQITEAYFSACTSIGNSAFANCTNLEKIHAQRCTYIGKGAFYWCTKLSDISFPTCTNIYYNAFTSCTSLSIADFPACTYIETSSNSSTTVFTNCTGLRVLSFPALTSVSAYMWSGYNQITEAHFSACSIIYGSAFRGCTNLKSLYLMSTGVVRLSHSNAMSNTNAALSIFVPSSLVNNYKASTNWTYYSSRIVGI